MYGIILLGLLASMLHGVHSQGVVQASDATVVIRPWGMNAIRVQICADVCDDALPGALGTSAPGASTSAQEARGLEEQRQFNGRTSATTRSGNLECSHENDGSLSFSRVDDSKLLLRTMMTHPL